MGRVLVQLEGILGDDTFVFDGVSMGCKFHEHYYDFATTNETGSPKELLPINESRTTVLNMGKRRDGRPNDIQIRITNRGKVDVRGLVHALRSGDLPANPMGGPLEAALKWIQALLRKFPSSQMVSKPNSTSYFHSDLPKTTLKSTGGVLEALRGIFQTPQMRFHRLTVNVDTAVSSSHIVALHLSQSY